MELVYYKNEMHVKPKNEKKSQRIGYEGFCGLIIRFSWQTFHKVRHRVPVSGLVPRIIFMGRSQVGKGEREKKWLSQRSWKKGWLVNKNKRDQVTKSDLLCSPFWNRANFPHLPTVRSGGFAASQRPCICRGGITWSI